MSVQTNEQKITQQQSNYCYPFNGTFKVTSDFNEKRTSETYNVRYHHGLDLVAQQSRTVVSITSGVVKRAQYQSGYGNYVWVQSDDGHGIIYAHLAETYVKVNQRVKVRTAIGKEGSTGHSTGLHLHLGVSTNPDYSATHAKQQTWINPFAYLGVSPYSNLKGKTFDGNGGITGVSSDISGDSSISNGSSLNTSQVVPSGQFYEVVDIQGTLSDWLYGRRYRVIVVMDDDNSLDVSEIRCTFDIPKTQFRQSDKAVVTLYNLSPDTENRIIKSGKQIIIEAGYNGSFYGRIYAGNIIQPIRSKENGTDYKLTLISMNTDRFLTYGLVGTTVVANQSARDAVATAASKANYPVETGSIADTNLVYPRGKVMFGKPSDYLDQIAKTMNATFYTEDGKINIVQAKQIPSNEIFDLGPETGLLGSPSQNETGIDFECLLNPLIVINSLVRIDNKKIAGYEWSQGKAIRSLDSQGIYRIIKVEYVGDTRGNDWKCRCSAITQAGTLPSFLSNPSLYGW